MMTMHDMTRLFGVTTEDLSNWSRRGYTELRGRRGAIREFTSADRRDCLLAAFSKALSGCFDIGPAFGVARSWVAEEGAGKMSRFWVLNDRSGEELAFQKEDVISYDLMGTLEDETPTGYVDRRQPAGPVPTGLRGTVLTIVDRGEIVRRLDEALAGQVG